MGIFKEHGSIIPDPLGVPPPRAPAAPPQATKPAAIVLWSGAITYMEAGFFTAASTERRELARIVVHGGDVLFERCDKDSMGDAKWTRYQELTRAPSISRYPFPGDSDRPYTINPAIRACIAAAAKDAT